MTETSATTRTTAENKNLKTNRSLTAVIDSRCAEHLVS
jgi:hypothetical protein